MTELPKRPHTYIRKLPKVYINNLLIFSYIKLQQIPNKNSALQQKTA